MTQAARRRVIVASTLFYPASTLYAMFVLPSSVLTMLGIVPAIPALASPAGHAHEMLFGFALAVVAGNQGGAVRAWRLAAVFALWLAARIAFLAAPHSAASLGANVAFAAALAAQLTPRLFRSAKKWRNQALPAVLAAICASAIAYHLAALPSSAGGTRADLIAAVLLFALLMLFMGGRILAPAVAGQLRRQGSRLDARVQPRLEAGSIIAMAVATLASLRAGEPIFLAISASATCAAGLLAGVRLLRWRLWALRGRPDLVCIGAGYGWLAVGLVFLGAASALGRHQAAAIHVITVGSLGTLTLNVMAMTSVLKARRDPGRAPLQVAGTCLLAAATVARLLAGLGPFDAGALLVLASLCWSAAFGLLGVLQVRLRLPSERLAGS